MRLGLGSVCGGRLLLAGVDGARRVSEVEIQVPGADDAVSAAGVASEEASVSRRSSRSRNWGLEDVQDGIVAVNGEATDAEAVAANGGFSAVEDCEENKKVSYPFR